MGHHPHSAVWHDGGTKKYGLNRLTDDHCQFLNDNVGISRRTLRHVHEMFNDKFELALGWEQFMALRADAISDGRCRTTYFRNYFKSENSSERELRLQKPFLKSRLVGGCQFRGEGMREACGAETSGRYCERHARIGYGPRTNSGRQKGYIDSTLGKYG